jgi:hypothetical protein
MTHLNLKFVSVEGCCIMTNTVKTWHHFCAVSFVIVRAFDYIRRGDR